MGEIKTEDSKVMQLAETLKKHGFAASMYEAVEKARSIMEVGIVTSGNQQKSSEAKDDEWDISKEDATLNELMGEIGVTPEQVKAQEKENLEIIKMEIGNITSEMEDAEKNPENIGQIKEEIAKVKAKVDKMAGNETENEQPQ